MMPRFKAILEMIYGKVVAEVNEDPIYIVDYYKTKQSTSHYAVIKDGDVMESAVYNRLLDNQEHNSVMLFMYSQLVEAQND